MRRRIAIWIVATLVVVVRAAWAAPARRAIDVSATLWSSDFLRTGMDVLKRLASAITEPFGLVLLGVSLIGLSWLVRRRLMRKLSRTQ